MHKKRIFIKGGSSGIGLAFSRTVQQIVYTFVALEVWPQLAVIIASNQSAKTLSIWSKG